MPFGESFISTLKSNKSIMLNKDRRFRKTLGGYDWIKKKHLNLPETTREEVKETGKRVLKENRIIFIKQLLVFGLIMTVVISLLIYMIF